MNRGGYSRGAGRGQGGCYNNGMTGQPQFNQGSQISGPNCIAFGGASAAAGGCGPAAAAARFEPEYELDPRLRRGRAGAVPPSAALGINSTQSGQQNCGVGRGRPIPERKPPLLQTPQNATHPPLIEIEDEEGYYSTPPKQPAEFLQNVHFGNEKQPPRPASTSSISGASGFSDVQPKTLPRNQCEIVYDTCIGNDRVEAYAFRLETSIRTLGLTVGTMYPRPGATVADVLRDLTKNGTAFAVLVNDGHVTHESFSLNILQPQELRGELRNIPHEAGLIKMREAKQKISQRKVVTIMPENIRTNFKQMVQGKFLSDLDYQICIKYIASRWELQREYEDKIDFDPGAGIFTEAQLKLKILEILDCKKIKGEGVKGNVKTGSEEIPLGRIKKEFMDTSTPDAENVKKSQVPGPLPQEAKLTPPPPPPVVGPIPAATSVDVEIGSGDDSDSDYEQAPENMSIVSDEASDGDDEFEMK